MTAVALGEGARLDSELVRRGLVRSRRRAVELVAEGKVAVGGATARKASQPVGPADEIRVDTGREYVSRGAHKLLGALDDLARLAPGAVDVLAARCLDAGASTGGFTQVLLERGAAHVLAVDVGHGQLAAELDADPRVTLVEGHNIRDGFADDVLGAPPAVVVADLSFISLTLVAGPLLRAARPGGDLLLLVKPQFEVGRERLGAGGVVGDPDRQADAVLAVARSFEEHGGRALAVLPSVLPGESGNREFFLWVRAQDVTDALGHSGVADAGAIARAVRTGRAVLLAAATGRAAL